MFGPRRRHSSATAPAPPAAVRLQWRWPSKQEMEKTSGGRIWSKNLFLIEIIRNPHLISKNTYIYTYTYIKHNDNKRFTRSDPLLPGVVERPLPDLQPSFTGVHRRFLEIPVVERLQHAFDLDPNKKSNNPWNWCVKCGHIYVIYICVYVYIYI